VIDLAAHPAALSRAMRAAPTAAKFPACPPAAQAAHCVAQLVAQRVARRHARMQLVAHGVRVSRFRPWFSLFRLWRRWRRGLPFSCLWCASAPLPAPPSSPGGAVRQLKRSPRPAGAHRWRDLSAIATRRTSRGNAVSSR